jgi:hypothetical protein
MTLLTGVCMETRGPEDGELDNGHPSEAAKRWILMWVVHEEPVSYTLIHSRRISWARKRFHEANWLG